MKIVCIGAGNVATHMAQAFKLAGNTIIQVWSRSLENASALGRLTGAEPINDLNKIDPDADLYLISVYDGGIIEVAERLKEITGLVLHTSGATDINSLAKLTHYGVLYPLQTFSKIKPIQFNQVPLCIEAVKPDDLALLEKIALQISPIVYKVDSRQRKILHLAAVFACNFTNHLYHISSLILEQHKMDFSLLKPLILETAEKIRLELPVSLQTGPAVRKDKQTMDVHKEMLKDLPNFREIYEILSNSIKKTHS